jgi:hypothetical protein
MYPVILFKNKKKLLQKFSKNLKKKKHKPTVHLFKNI